MGTRSNEADPVTELDEPVKRTGQAALFRAFKYPLFRRVFAAQILFGFANWMNRLAVGWIVLDQTGSAFLTTLSFAVQTAPGMLVAPFAGAISDRVDRRIVLGASGLGKASVMILLAMSVILVEDAVWLMIPLVAIVGALTSFEIPSTQAMVVDVVNSEDAANGIATQSSGMRAVSIIGGISGGVLLDLAGGPAVFITAAVVFGAGALVVSTIGTLPKRLSTEARRSVLGNTVDGLKTMSGIPTVRTLLILAVFVEIFAFSFMSVLPVVAKERLEVGGIGLGALSAMSGVGGLSGSLWLVFMSQSESKGKLLLGAGFLYGVGILLLSGSGWFAISLLIMVGIGFMAAVFDALEWTLLQLHVPDAMRGRAVSGWVFAIGFGWIGHLELGAVSDSIGVQWALAINGALVVVVIIVALLMAPRLRSA
ncbi:MAG: MFS transporter [Chloroflexi bacterium]|nr:MFS transporter [Chloroflexota bacterium]